MMGSSAPSQCASTVNISLNDNKDYYWPSLLPHIKRLFVNRYDCFALQNSHNPLLFPTIYESLTDDIIFRSLSGDMTIGIHQISHENKIKWLCWDIDRKHTAEPKRLTDTLIKYLREWYHLTGHLEKSGSPDSYHVWLFTHIDFETAYAFNQNFLGRLKALVDIKSIEKGISKGAKGLGCMIKLPLNINRKNGARSEFLSDLTKIVPETLPTLKTEQLQHNHPTTPKPPKVVGGVVLENNKSDNIDPCQKIINKNPKVLERINHFQGDRSKLDFLIVKCLAECSISKNTIYSFLKTVRHSKIHERGYPYFSLTYDNVQKTLSNDTYYQNKRR